MKKKLLLSLGTVIAMLAIAEIGGRLLFFHYRSEATSGAVYLASGLRTACLNFLINRKVSQARLTRDERNGYETALFSKEGEPVLSHFKTEYEENYRQLVEECRKMQAELMVVYFRTSKGEAVSRDDTVRDYFRALGQKYGVKFIDMSPTFALHPEEEVFLFPENGHLSRFGNRLLAAGLNEELLKMPAKRSTAQYDGRPAVCGDLAPSSDDLWNMVPSMPYRVVVNRQGFRTTQDLEIPKKRQRVLCLGDSYTFGPYLPNHDTYPELWNKMNRNVEAINAGICGFTITDEVSLLMEKARLVAPDVVVLQMVENDITGLFWFMKNEFDRKHLSHAPRVEEEALINEVIKANRNAKAQ